MLTREQVIAAYEALLGRGPRNETETADALASHADVRALRQHLLTSREFAPDVAMLVLQRAFALDRETIQTVQTKADPHQLQRLLNRIRETWVRIGKTDSYWSVLSWDIFKDGLSENANTFWESGRSDIERLNVWLCRNEIPKNPAWTCLEYGCGAGRDTRWLCSEFGRVIAMDISSSHLEVAAKAVGAQHPNAQFVEVQDLSAYPRLPEFDLLFSLLVLQHNPPPLIAFILDSLLGRLRQGGIAYFQVPTLCRNYSFDLDSYLALDRNEGFEMHVIPQREVFEILRRNGCELLEVQADDKAGSLDFVSNTFLARKVRQVK